MSPTQSAIIEKFDSTHEEAMLDLREVFSLTEFLRNHRERIARLQETRKPVVLTVKGRPAVVMQDAEGYQHLLDELEDAKRELEKVRDAK